MGLDDLIATEDKMKPYSPPKHKLTVNRRLIGGDGVPSERVELILGELSPGGEAERHSHTGSEQILYVLDGRCRVEALGQERVLEPGTAVRFPEGLEHRIVVLDEKTLRCIVIYSPPIYGTTS